MDLGSIGSRELLTNLQEKKKTQLIYWNQICKAKDQGSRPLQRSGEVREQKLALLSKLVWKVTTNDNSILDKIPKPSPLASTCFPTGQVKQNLPDLE